MLLNNEWNSYSLFKCLIISFLRHMASTTSTTNVSTSKAYIIHFFHYFLSEFQKIIPSLWQIKWNSKRNCTWFLFSIFKSPWLIPVNTLPVSPWPELDNDRFHCQALTFILIRLTYTMQPIYLLFLVIDLVSKISETRSFWLSFLSNFKLCIQRQDTFRQATC